MKAMRFRKFLAFIAVLGVVSNAPLNIHADTEAPKSFHITNEISDNFAQKVINSYLQIPESVRLSFENSGGTIELSTNDLGVKFYGKENTVLAYIDTDTLTIYIDYREKAVKSVQHEIGHYLDYSNGWLSSTDEFKRIHNEEVSSFCKVHKTAKQNTNTTVEYFAESFEFYINNSQTLLASCPQTYAFIDAIVKGGN